MTIKRIFSNETLLLWEIVLVKHSYDYRPIWTPLDPITIIKVYLTIIPRAHVGYEMIDSQRGA